MTMIKKLSIIAAIILLIGIIGSIVTYESSAGSYFSKTEETIEMSEITNMMIKTENARVIIQPTTSSEALVELSGNRTNYELTTEKNESTLSIDLQDERKKQLINISFRPKGLTMTVSVPEKHYNQIQLETRNGRIDVANIQTNDLNAISNNGRVDMKEINGTTITAETRNGELRLANLTADLVDLTARNGSIKLTDVDGDGELKGKTANGSITLDTDTLDRNIHFETNNGSIKITTNHRPANATFDTRTKNGSIRIFGERIGSTTTGDGEHQIKLTTNNGSITVED
ncbi:DUF4097 family beta strand repeat-containing protein [Evansella tamaricis]|uniref:DUF4097 domain-containing protein n=1 Tax=Evansella tamaricis TaxID=2069301 RepID=A0ABS6J964_9BACI|nr:DUF4097 family beta strand repeat-containing protein [Evansella tamaricis]MBU9710222.1 DUF4097 domain-containing protein [Evansella tamaricis]